MGSTIQDISYFLPTRTLGNEELAMEYPGLSAGDIFRQSGIRKRHLADDSETPADLAIYAAEALFAKPENEKANIDALIFCTEGLDYKGPATSCIIHKRLNLKPSCLSLDVPSGCTGFMNGLLVAKSLIGQNGIAQVLLLTAEIPTRVIDKKDIHLRVLFGDGAAATIISSSNSERIGNFSFGTDGAGACHLWVERSGFRNPVDQEWLQKHSHDPKQLKYGKMIMDGKEMLHFALTHVPALIQETLTKNQLTQDEVDLFIFHQASDIILRSLRRKCRIPEEKFFCYLESCGNTVSSTIPITLAKAKEIGAIKKGSKVLLAGFGIGLSWAACVIYID